MKEVCDYWVDEREKQINESTTRQAFEDLEEAMCKLIDVIYGFEEVGIKCEDIHKSHKLLSDFMKQYEDEEE